MRSSTHLIEQLSSLDQDERLAALRGFFDCHHRLVVFYAHRALQRTRRRGDFVAMEPEEAASCAFQRLARRLRSQRLNIARGWGGWCSYVERAVLSAIRDAKRRTGRFEDAVVHGVHDDSESHLHAVRHFKCWCGPIASNGPSNADPESVSIEASVECNQPSDAKSQAQRIMEAASRCLTRPQYALFRRFVDQLAGDACTVAQAARRLDATAKEIRAVLEAIQAQLAA